MHTRTLLAIGIAGALIFSASIGPRPASAQTLDSIQSQIQQLLAKIGELTSQLGILRSQQEVSTPSTPATVSSAPRHRICSLLYRNLSQGVSGDDVMGLQEFLREQGHFSANATGYFGPVTAQALARWQTSEGVESVGAAGPITRERIKIWCGGGTPERFSAEPTRGTAPLAVVFKTNITLANPRMVADAGDYKIVFGDGGEQKLSCESGTGGCRGPHRVDHTYALNGTYTASLVHYGYFGGPGLDSERVVGAVTIHVGDQACTKEYKPVCGLKQVQCFTTPCNPIQQTYSNRCMMAADGATFLYEGACGSPSNKPPVISGFSGPTLLAVNETGTWKIQASDPEFQQLSYYITWGDEANLVASQVSMPRQEFVQATTFTHVYSIAGRYTVTIVVRDTSNNEVRTTSTVSVTGSVVCTLEYSPVCGQPPEPACRYIPPYCLLPTPAPQTYANKCLLNAAGARFLYEGVCSTYPTACTADAMLCPDGSYVGRTGPNCEFKCPSATSCVTPWGNQTVAHNSTIAKEPYFTNGMYSAGMVLVLRMRCSSGSWLQCDAQGNNCGTY